MEIALVLVIVLVLVGSVAGVAVSRRRSRTVELEPPPAAPPPVAPPPAGPPVAPPETEAEAERDSFRVPKRSLDKRDLARELELDPSLVEQLEAALKAPEIEVPEAPAPEAPAPEAPAPEAPGVPAPPAEAPTPLEAPPDAPSIETAPPLEAPAAPTVPPVEAPAPAPAPPVEAPAPAPAPPVEAPPVRPRFRDRLTKARDLFAGYVGSVMSRSTIDEETWDDLEEALVRADVGVALATDVLDDLRRRVKDEGITTPEALVEGLKATLKARLSEGDRALRLEKGVTNVWLFVGVNGVGKTTTIGKIGRQAAAQGIGVVMAAGDTFRAAAAEQLELWAERVGADLVRGAEGSDPGAVVFDAVERAAARRAELVLGDTAGRLHTKVNLMEELRKVRRVAERPPGHLNEVLLVIDATTGQNGLIQAREFTDAVGVTGIVLTKLDGTAKGGIAVAIQTQLGIPIKLVGLGEGPDDITEFDPDEFVDALFG